MRTAPYSRACAVLLFLLPYLTPAAASARFALADAYVGRDFLSSWDWETDNDPTHGRVNYVNQGTALAHNLTYGAPLSIVSSLPPKKAAAHPQHPYTQRVSTSS